MSAILYADRPITFDGPVQWLPGEIIQTSDGFSAIQLPAGGVLSVQPDGSYTTAPSVRGAWERCTKGSANTLNYSPCDNRRVYATYAIPFRDQ